MRIIIGGDLVPTPSNFRQFYEGRVSSIMGSLYNLWLNADVRLFNLEAPISDKLTPIKKYGPNLKIPTSCLNGLLALKPSAICLANNHIMDQGRDGLEQTCKSLTSLRIPFFGAGMNLEESKRPLLLNGKDLRIAIVACAEHEFSIADENRGGANPFEALETPDQIYELKKMCKYVIVLYHGGREHYRYPSPDLQKRCRKLAEKGADLVVCQHSHCIGCREKWFNAEICYGQGNFLFDWSDAEEWQTSLLLIIDIKDNDFKVKYVPFVKKNNGIDLPDSEVHKEILRRFYERSNKIINSQFVKQNFEKEASNALPTYINIFKNSVIQGMINYLDCESHREIFISGIKNL